MMLCNILILSISCNKEQDTHNYKWFENEIDNIYSSNMEHPIWVNLKVKDYSFPSNENEIEYQNHWGDNTYIIDGIPYNVCISNSYNLQYSDSSLKVIGINRRISKKIVAENNEEDASEDILLNNYIVTLQSVEPIYIYSPYFSNCNTIPYCYYENMQIDWNANIDPDKNLYIITMWNGTYFDEPAVQQTVVHVDVVNDNGSAVLNNNLFDDMPDGALVTLMLVRANFIEVTLDDSEVQIEDVDWSRVYEILIETEQIHQLYTVVSGAMARFTMVLVKNM